VHPTPPVASVPASPASAQTEARRRLVAARSFGLKVLLQFLLVIVGIVIFDPMKEWWLGPPQYKIYLVGWTENDEVKKMFRTMEDDTSLARLRIDGKDIVVKEENDGGDPSRAKQVATELANRDDTLMVIGHVMSQSTISALPVYMGTQPQVPVIATRETHPDLLKGVTSPDCRSTDVYCAFMPMSPTDTDQAKTAVEFAVLIKHSRTFLIVKDNKPRNEEYAANLSADYAQLIQEKHATLVATTPVSDQVSLDAALDQMAKYRPDCVLFIGPVDNAQSFLDALAERVTATRKGPVAAKASEGLHNTPLLLFSDSAVGSGLFSAQARFSDSASAARMSSVGTAVYATFPLSGEEYGDINNVYGDDAVSLAGQLIDEVERENLLPKVSWFRNLISMHRVRDARAAIVMAMEKNAENSTAYITPHRKYQYFEKYSLHNLHFHVWEIQ
jgi:hypothetical protein